MLININRYKVIVIVDFSITKNFILLFLASRKKFSIYIKKYVYILIFINKNLLLNKNERIEKKIKLLLVTI